jgi:Tfp pilus assembly PilM family ATPase
MARFLALEWDNYEARAAVASSRGNEILLEHAFSVPLAARDGEVKSDSSPAAIGERIKAALAQQRVKSAEALVAVGRSNIELKQLSLPPVPDEELPDMVRFQAMREFHSLAENWPLDFLPIHETGQENRSVLAAAMSPELLGQFQQVCESAGVKPTRLVLRPCAAASLFLRRPESTAEPVRLVIDLLNEEADLTVLVNRDAVFLRTTRLPADALSDPENSRPLVAEIRRTLAAAQNQLVGRKVEAIYVCSTASEHAAIISRLEQELGLPTRLFDPLAGLQIDSGLKKNLPANIGRYAPLLGMLADEIEQVQHGMDFLNPRRKPELPNQRNRYAGYGLALCAVLLLGAFLIWQRLAALDAEIARLNQDLKAYEPVIKSSKEVEKSVAEIKKWSVSDITWLDELRELSDEFPPAQEAMLTHLRFGQQSDGGLMTLEGLVKQASNIDLLQTRLRDERHSIEPKESQQDNDIKQYGWQFKSEIMVKPPAAANLASAVKQAGGTSKPNEKVAQTPAGKKSE